MNPSPNIIVITTDQQRFDSLGCIGSDFISTPNLDRLAAEGVLFTRAYCSNPVCTPARASIFTGQNLSTHGAWNVGTKIPTDTILLSHRLKELGYRTHYVGKMHFQPFGHTDSCESQINWNNGKKLTTGPYYGFDTVELACGHTIAGMTGAYGEWILDKIDGDREKFEQFKQAHPLTTPNFHANAMDTELPVKYQNSVWTAERTCAFLQSEEAQKPFLLGVGFEDPHHPHAVPKDYKNRVDPAKVPLPDYDEGELDDKPPHYNLARCSKLHDSCYSGEYTVAGVGDGYHDATPEAGRLARAYYYTLIQLIDEQLGRILDCLDREGLADNTIVVFTSDHGELLGDHGLWLKGPFHYEQMIKIPLIIRWPKGFVRGLASEELFSQIDIVPTLMSAVGVDHITGMDGLDMTEILRGKRSGIRTHALVECYDDPKKLRLKTVVTRDRKCTWYKGEDFGELYDLEKDPREKINLWDNQSYTADKNRLLGMIDKDFGDVVKRVRRICYA